MKKIWTIMLAAVIGLSLACTVWAGEPSTEVEIAPDAMLDGVAGEDREMIIDLLEVLPGSGVFEMLEGTLLQMNEELSKGTVSENTGRRELAFTDGYYPKTEPSGQENRRDKITLTKITRMPEYFEVSFDYTDEFGIKTEYQTRMELKDVDGTKRCVLMRLWKENEEITNIEAVSEVFEDYFEEVIEPLY